MKVIIVPNVKPCLLHSEICKYLFNLACFHSHTFYLNPETHAHYISGADGFNAAKALLLIENVKYSPFIIIIYYL